MNDYTCNPQQRILKLIMILSGNEFDGVRPTAIANAMSIQASTITRDLRNLKAGGFAEQVPGKQDCWRLSPRMLQIANTYQLNIQTVQQRIEETRQRFTCIQ